MTRRHANVPHHGPGCSPAPWPRAADVTIIGNGASGVALLTAFDKAFGGADRLRIVLLGERDLLGRGNCYHEDQDCLLMNIASDFISVYPSDPQHFSRWLREQANADGMQFAPRHLYGKYLGQVGQSVAASGRHEVALIDGKASTIVRNSRSITVIGAKGQRIESSIVILATGISSSQDIYGLCGHENHIDEPFPTSNFQPKIARKKTVIVLGSSLSAVDIAITLRSAGHRGQIYFVSRQGKLPTVKGLRRTHAPQHCTHAALTAAAHARNGSIGLRDIVRALRKDFGTVHFRWQDLVAADGPDDAALFRSRVDGAQADIPWLNMLNALQSQLDRIWPNVRTADRTLLIQRYLSPVLHKIAAIPMANAAQIDAMLLSGALTNLGGVVEVTFKHGRFHCRFGDRSEISADYVINATGPSRQITGHFLLALRDARILQENPAGGVAVCPHSGRIWQPGNGYDDRVYALGHLTCGVHPIINNISSIVACAKSLVDAVYRDRRSLFQTADRHAPAASSA